MQKRYVFGIPVGSGLAVERRSEFRNRRDCSKMNVLRSAANSVLQLRRTTCTCALWRNRKQIERGSCSTTTDTPIEHLLFCSFRTTIPFFIRHPVYPSSISIRESRRRHAHSSHAPFVARIGSLLFSRFHVF